MDVNEDAKHLSGNVVLDSLHPTIALIAAVVGVVVWAYSTFATIGYVKEQHKETTALIEQRFLESKEHSDMNRDRQIAVMNEIKEMVRELQARIDAAPPQRKRHHDE